MAHDVFICHSSRDKEIADAVCATLEAQGVTCWIAPRDIQAGTSYAEGIISAIAGARAMVLVFSADANSSQQVEREIERAVHHNIPLIPFRIENIRPERALEYFLATPHWLDAFTPPMGPHLSRLAAQVTALLGKPPAERPVPTVAPAAAPAMAAAAVVPPPTALAAPHPIPPPHRSNNALVLVAGGVVAFSVLVLAAVIFLKPFGSAPTAPPTNAATNVAAAAPANAAAPTNVATNAAPTALATASPSPAPAPNPAPAPAPAPTTAAAPAPPAAPPAPTPVRLTAGECRTSDPTGTPLNIRSRPGGDIVGAIDNGIVVRTLDHRRGLQGRLWAMVEPVNHAGQNGWVFENFLSCPQGDPGAESASAARDETATGPEPPPERPSGRRPGRFQRAMGGPG